MKKCKKCELLKNFDEFYKRSDSKDGYYHECIECIKIRTDLKYAQNPSKKLQKNKEWAKQNPQIIQEIAKKYRDSHSELIQRAKILARYGITKEEYDQRLENQEGKCKICKETCSTGHNLSVDHVHKTGKIRGLLCKACNLGLGKFRDNIEFLKEAIKYLEENDDFT
jgi:hypothetical protein